jgi:hypothetical protein
VAVLEYSTIQEIKARRSLLGRCGRLSEDGKSHGDMLNWISGQTEQLRMPCEDGFGITPMSEYAHTRMGRPGVA